MCDVSDVQNDIKEHFEVVGSSLSRRIRGCNAYQQAWGNVNEKTSLLPESMSATPKNGSSISSSSEGIDALSDTPPDSLNVVNT